MSRIAAALVVAIFSLAAGPSLRADDPPAAAAADDATRWKAVADALGHAGVPRGKVYTVAVPRADLDVTTDAGPVPNEAGLESVFHFYPCDCGKINVVGQFVLLDFEANDVIDELRKGMVKVVAVSPLLLGERPRLTQVRFQGEGGGAQLAATLRAALDWTGDARMAPATRPAAGNE